MLHGFESRRGCGSFKINRRHCVKTNTLIFCVASPRNPGDQIAGPEGGTFEVTRNLTIAEAEKFSPEFVSLMLRIIPGKPIYFIECREVESVRQERTSSEVRCYEFRSTQEMQLLEQKIVKKSSALLAALKRGCFYFTQTSDGEVLYWVFLYCDEIPTSVSKRVNQLANKSGGCQVVGSPYEQEDLLQFALQGFLKMLGKSFPGQLVEKKSIN